MGSFGEQPPRPVLQAHTRGTDAACGGEAELVPIDVGDELDAGIGGIGGPPCFAVSRNMPRIYSGAARWKKIWTKRSVQALKWWSINSLRAECPWPKHAGRRGWSSKEWSTLRTGSATAWPAQPSRSSCK